MPANDMRHMIDLVEAALPTMHVEIVPLSSFKTHDEDPDDYLYHVTSVPNAHGIMTTGFQTNRKPTVTNYARYSRGKIFFTERDGVPFWIERVEDHLFHEHDNPPDVAILRVPKAELMDHVTRDEVGSRDARASAYYLT